MFALATRTEGLISFAAIVLGGAASHYFRRRALRASETQERLRRLPLRIQIRIALASARGDRLADPAQQDLLMTSLRETIAHPFRESASFLAAWVTLWVVYALVGEDPLRFALLGATLIVAAGIPFVRRATARRALERTSAAASQRSRLHPLAYILMVPFLMSAGLLVWVGITRDRPVLVLAAVTLVLPLALASVIQRWANRD